MHDNESAVRALQAAISRHNFRVFGLILITAGTALVLWGVLYLAAMGLWLGAQTAWSGAEAHLPERFGPIFAGVAAVSCLLALLLRRLWPDGLPRDKATFFDHLTDSALMLPRITLAVWGTLSAWQRLNRSELEAAADLVQRLGREHKVEFSRVALDFPDPRAQQKVVLALQIMDLAYFLRNDEGVYLMGRQQNLRPLCRPRVRIAPPRPRQRNPWTNTDFPA